MKMKLWLRNLLTRCIAIAPGLVACILGGSRGAAKLIIVASVIPNQATLNLVLVFNPSLLPKLIHGTFYVQMILSFELPFALVPLLRFTSSEAKMGLHKNPTVVRFCNS